MDKQGKPKIIIKLGTSTLTQGTDKISRAKLEDIAIQMVELRKQYDVILVSSGAIAAAKQFLKLEKIGNQLNEKQALAAIGQPFLMRLMQDAFRDYEIAIGQCLLSSADFKNEVSKKNTINTIDVLLKNNILPIINENDTTATEEIKFGDNDKLSALSAVLLQAKLLVLATNTNGIYDHNKTTILDINNIEEVIPYIQTEKSKQGTGGMQTKLEAAKIAQDNHIESWIVNGHEQSFILKAFRNEINYSTIHSKIST